MSTSGQVNRAATSFAYTQAAPALSWTIVHGLDTYPVVDVFVSVNGSVQKIIPMSVVYVDGKTVTVNFSQPTAGFATIV